MTNDEKSHLKIYKQTPISLRIFSNTLEKVDKIAEDTGSSRSAVLIKAIQYYVNSPRCINCGAVNPSGGINCAVCSTPIYTDDEIAWALTSLGTVGGMYGSSDLILPINSLLDVAKKYYLKYKDMNVRIISTYSIDKSQTPTEYRIKLNILSQDNNSPIVPPFEDLLDKIFLEDGVVVPQRVLIDRLNFNRANMQNLYYTDLSAYLESYFR